MFTETANKVVGPNDALPAQGSTTRIEIFKRQRKIDCILYIGKARNLHTRLPGYLVPDYEKRRPEKHKGRTLLHAYQYTSPELYLRYAVVGNSLSVEQSLIRELHPVLNTVDRIDDRGVPLKRRDLRGGG